MSQAAKFTECTFGCDSYTGASRQALHNHITSKHAEQYKELQRLKQQLRQESGKQCNLCDRYFKNDKALHRHQRDDRCTKLKSSTGAGISSTSRADVKSKSNSEDKVKDSKLLNNCAQTIGSGT